MKTLKVLGILLTYPSAEQIAAFPEFKEILIKENWLPDNSIKQLEQLMNWMAAEDLLDLQEEFVALFDRTPSLCLHLFEHVHGDSRDRGQALVDLSEVYKDVGLLINTKEMPDFLPLFLEYLSIINPEEAAENLGEIANLLGVLSERLNNRQSLYSNVLDALIAAAKQKPDTAAVKQALKDAGGKASTFDELDQAWEEQNAFENSLTADGDNNSCPLANDMVAKMNLPDQNKEIQ